MVETKVYCDACSERITEDRSLLKVVTGPERLKRPTIDLCTSCLSRVVELIDARPENCTAPTPRASVAARVGSN